MSWLRAGITKASRKDRLAENKDFTMTGWNDAARGGAGTILLRGWWWSLMARPFESRQLPARFVISALSWNLRHSFGRYPFTGVFYRSACTRGARRRLVHTSPTYVAPLTDIRAFLRRYFPSIPSPFYPSFPLSFELHESRRCYLTLTIIRRMTTL